LRSASTTETANDKIVAVTDVAFAGQSDIAVASGQHDDDALWLRRRHKEDVVWPIGVAGLRQGRFC
jgi:hypothetical protein